MCLIKLGRTEDTKNHLSKILELNPYRAEAHLLMAKILMDQKAGEEAREHLIVAKQVWDQADSAYV